MKPGGLIQPLRILEWKWDDISMDFIVSLSLTAHKFDSIWVIMDRLTKSAHFILVNTNYNTQQYAEIYIARVLCLHGVLKIIICNRGSQFVARCWEQQNASLGTHLIHSSTYHPRKDCQTEQVNQILEDILRACVMEHQGSWDQNLPWVEFSYNNSYQESLKMALFEVLYGHRCHTPFNCIELGEKVVFGPDLIDEADVTICCIQDNLKVTKLCHKSYVNKRSRPLEYKVGGHMYLRVSPMKGVKRFGMKGKLVPHYIGHFPILEKCGTVHPSLTYCHTRF
jgi:hypothetical protein